LLLPMLPSPWSTLSRDPSQYLSADRPSLHNPSEVLGLPLLMLAPRHLSLQPSMRYPCHSRRTDVPLVLRWSAQDHQKNQLHNRCVRGARVVLGHHRSWSRRLAELSEHALNQVLLCSSNAILHHRIIIIVPVCIDRLCFSLSHCMYYLLSLNHHHSIFT
jgi:hypothetical protein